MKRTHILRAWKSVLSGRAPSLSLEITRECPLRCPGCYAYEPNHLGGGTTLRQLSDFKGDELVRRAWEIVERLRPLHVSIVGGDPLVRYREMEILVPRLLHHGIHVQFVTSAFRQLPAGWAGYKTLTVAVSIDGLPAEHDIRRAPATYERILKNIAGQRITVHCTITSQMMKRPGYLDEFLEFWSARQEVEKIWFSIFTPQRGAEDVERLTPPQRQQVVDELMAARLKHRKAAMPAAVLRQFLRPPSSPSECLFAMTTETISADLQTRITPCQFGGDPDCSQCGCMASMGLASIGDHKLGGVLPVASLFHASYGIGKLIGGHRNRSATREGAIADQPALVKVSAAAPRDAGGPSKV
jgi:MoaA/NifB/PqqE/SkfB family radical SAM enzyme